MSIALQAFLGCPIFNFIRAEFTVVYWPICVHLRASVAKRLLSPHPDSILDNSAGRGYGFRMVITSIREFNRAVPFKPYDNLP